MLWLDMLPGGHGNPLVRVPTTGHSVGSVWKTPYDDSIKIRRYDVGSPDRVLIG